MSLQKLLALAIIIFAIVLLVGFIGYLVLDPEHNSLTAVYMATITVLKKRSR